MCGHVNYLWLTDLGAGLNTPHLVACDTEGGGCDSYFSYQPVVTITVKVVALAKQFNEVQP
jgi:hypothetical protein